ncbi:SDR family NAD(P)-dependent oxidoreductase [Streptomyces sp. NPDC007901]|uniref:SDR family NAD(P)-dependent oxidoreductase n=1 Tax=Streptomyces sp. NPDC007901 TaxID=3364785 RepID=UPI0036E35922
MPRPPFTPIAIVGASALLPGPAGIDGFWRTVFFGTDQVSDVPPTHWLVEDYYEPDPAAEDKCYAYRGGFLSPVMFDPLRFGVPPAALPTIDTAQLLTMAAAERLLSALASSGAPTDRSRTSVILGISGLEMLATMGARMQRPVWLKALRESGVPESLAQSVCDRIAAHYPAWQESSLPGMLTNVVAGRLANRFDLHGTNYTTDAACASSLAALSSAANQLALQQADLVVTGGIDTFNDPLMYTSFSKTPALSPTGDCRPFSSDADGMVLGEGVVLLALRRLTDAERDGNRILAVIHGIGAASDGSGGAIYAPQSSGQARALRTAYEAAGYGPDSVELIEAHGTGTAAGDAAETSALREVFGASGRDDDGWCALGSVKSQIGHTKAAAGAASLLKAALAVHHGILPPTIKVDRPNPKLGLDGSPFYLNTRSRPWIRDGGRPRRAGVSSFGFGGTNFHVTLSEHVPEDDTDRDRPRLRTSGSELVLLSAESPGELRDQVVRLADGRIPLAVMARWSQETFEATAPARLGVVATGESDLATKLRSLTDRIASDPETSFTVPGGLYGAHPADPGPVAFLFSGQGSQYVGMGAELAMSLPEALASWDSVAAMPCSTADGERLHRVVFPPPAFTAEERTAQRDRLIRTEWAQPALAAQSLAVLELLRLLGVRPDAVAGHSFGELVALHAAGSYDRETLLRLARRRGELMRDAAREPGAMTAVFGTPDEVRALVAAVGSDTLWLANHNTPRQVVVAGTTDAVKRLEQRAEASGHTVRRLDTATAFHSPVVAAAAEPFRQALDAEHVEAPRIPTFRNTTARPYADNAEAVRAGLAEQLTAPVRFVEQIEAMYAAGIRTFVEVGANATLTGFTSQILEGREHLAVSLDRERAAGLTAVQEALARLAVGGLDMEFAELWHPYTAGMEENPDMNGDTSGSSRTAVELLGTNYQKSYPPPDGSAALPPPNPDPEPARSATPTGTATTAPIPAPEQSGAPTQPAGWLATLAETQRLASAAHATYQQVMADSHLAFLRMSEAALTRLGGDLGITTQVALARIYEPQAVTTSPAVPASAPEPSRAVPIPGLSVPTSTPGPVTVPTTPGSSPQIEPETLPFEETTPTMHVTVDAVMSAVSQKTGYPIDVLTPDMDLVTDLGVDSIKRVEILAAIRDRVTVPDVDPAVLGAARTVRDVAEVLATAGPHSEVGSVPDGERQDPVSGVTVDAVMSAVSEKTGYPIDVLTPDMDLVTDLGVDSIKRVEILAAIRDRVTVPDVDAAVLGAARTVRDVAEVLGSKGASAPEPVPSAPPLRFTARQVAAPACGFATPALTAGPVAVVGGPAELADALAARLGAGGVEAYAASEVPENCDGLICLGGFEQTSRSADGANREAFAAVKAFAMARHDGPTVLVVVQSGTWASGLTALARTAAREWPQTTVRSIDCDLAGLGPEQAAELIASELLTGGSDPEVTLSAEGRTVRVFAELTGPTGTGRVGPHSVLVVSGGARGITAASVRALVETHTPKAVLLLGRTPLTEEPLHLSGAADEAAVQRAVIDRLRSTAEELDPRRIRTETASALAQREVRDTLRALEAGGSAVRYTSVDITDADAVRAAVAGFREEWGPVTAVVHGAGVLADAVIRDKTSEQFDRVYSTKVDGLRSLLAAVEDEPLDLLCVFSSVAAEFGNAGQSDYAMANEVVPRIAAAEGLRRPDCLVRTIAWGPWSAGMVDESLAAHFRAGGVELIETAAGAAAFVDELHESDDGAAAVIRSASRPPIRRGVSGELSLSKRSHPFLADHEIAGLPVVPVALVLEWLTGAARATFPGERAEVGDLDVLSKIGLEDFATASRRLWLDTRANGGTFTVQLTGPGGRPHYRAALAPSGDPVASRAWRRPVGLSEPDRVIYDGHLLFHGPAFRALTAVDAIGQAGAVGTLCGVTELGWPEEPWHTDPAAVDGCMQLAAAWAAQVLDVRATLPMGVGAFRVFVPGPLRGPAIAVVRAGRAAGNEAYCSVQASDPDGHPLFELTDVRLLTRPDAPRTETLAND